MLTQLTGRVDVGDAVVVNTTAVELGLGTGGWHVVHWNLARREWSEPGPGHIIKGRYTSLQADVGSTEEHWPELADVDSIDGMPVVAAALHSQLPAIAAAFKQRASRRAPRVRDDRRRRAAARALRSRRRAARRATSSTRRSRAGTRSAATTKPCRCTARSPSRTGSRSADAAVVVMGPGIVGTATRLGFSGIEVGPILDAAAGLHGHADRVPARVVRRPARAAPRRLAPQRRPRSRSRPAARCSCRSRRSAATKSARCARISTRRASRRATRSSTSRRSASSSCSTPHDLARRVDGPARGRRSGAVRDGRRGRPRAPPRASQLPT